MRAGSSIVDLVPYDPLLPGDVDVFTETEPAPQPLFEHGHLQPTVGAHMDSLSDILSDLNAEIGAAKKQGPNKKPKIDRAKAKARARLLARRAARVVRRKKWAARVKALRAKVATLKAEARKLRAAAEEKKAIAAAAPGDPQAQASAQAAEAQAQSAESQQATAESEAQQTESAPPAEVAPEEEAVPTEETAPSEDPGAEELPQPTLEPAESVGKDLSRGFWVKTRFWQEGPYLKSSTICVSCGNTEILNFQVDMRPIARALTRVERRAKVSGALVEWARQEEAEHGHAGVFGPRPPSRSVGAVFGQRHGRQYSPAGGAGRWAVQGPPRYDTEAVIGWPDILNPVKAVNTVVTAVEDGAKALGKAAEEVYDTAKKGIESAVDVVEEGFEYATNPKKILEQIPGVKELAKYLPDLPNPMEVATGMASAIASGDLDRMKDEVLDVAQEAVDMISTVPAIGGAISGPLNAALTLIDTGSPLKAAISTLLGQIPGIPPMIREILREVLFGVADIVEKDKDVTDVLLSQMKRGIAQKIRKVGAPSAVASLADDAVDAAVQLIVRKKPIRSESIKIAEAGLKKLGQPPKRDTTDITDFSKALPSNSREAARIRKEIAAGRGGRKAGLARSLLPGAAKSREIERARKAVSDLKVAYAKANEARQRRVSDTAFAKARADLDEARKKVSDGIGSRSKTPKSPRPKLYTSTPVANASKQFARGMLVRDITNSVSNFALKTGFAAGVTPELEAVREALRDENVDYVLMGELKAALQATKDVKPYAEIVLASLPGLGTGTSAGWAGAVALSSGRRIDKELSMAVRQALGNDADRAVFDSGLKSAKLAKKSEITAVRQALPEARRRAFDAGYAVGRGALIQASKPTDRGGFFAKFAPAPSDQDEKTLAVHAAAGDILDRLHAASTAKAALENIGRSKLFVDKVNASMAKIGPEKAKASLKSHPLLAQKVRRAMLVSRAGQNISKKDFDAPIQEGEKAMKEVAKIVAASKSNRPEVREAGLKAIAALKIVAAERGRIANTILSHGGGIPGMFIDQKGRVVRGKYVPKVSEKDDNVFFSRYGITTGDFSRLADPPGSKAPPSLTRKAPTATARPATPARPSESGRTGVGNPASDYCVRKRGGRIEIVNTPQGQSGMCVLPDGRRVPEWDLFRSQTKVSGYSQFGSDIMENHFQQARAIMARIRVLPGKASPVKSMAQAIHKHGAPPAPPSVSGHIGCAPRFGLDASVLVGCPPMPRVR